MEKRFPKRIETLSDICAFADEFISRNKITGAHAYTIQLSLEEVFTNMVKYGAESGNDVLIALEKDGPRAIMSLTDYDVSRFDIREAGIVDTGRSAGETPVGGLGIHLVRSFVDEIGYTYENRNSTVTLSLDVERSDV
ncbi:MAG: ATP-binding protein [Candidatus Zixiibacteriota bacterium]